MQRCFVSHEEQRDMRTLVRVRLRLRLTVRLRLRLSPNPNLGCEG